MSDETQETQAGSETSGEPVETTEVETTETATETAQAEEAAADAEGAAEQKAGDACTCPDGRTGTLHAGDEEGTFVCIPNEG